MKVELLRTLKGEAIWAKGTVFDDAVSPLPRDVQEEVKARAKTVRIIPDPSSLFGDEEEPDYGWEDGEVDMGATEQIPEVDEVVEVVLPPEIVAPEPTTESEAKETPTIIFPELEGLIQASGSLAQVARTFGVTYVTVGRWRQKLPKPEIVKRIKREYKRLANDQNRADDTPSGGSEGPIVELG